MGTKLNILVEEATDTSYKCINTKIIDKLRGWQKQPDIVWQKGNLHVWRLMQKNKEQFNFVPVKEFNKADDTPTIYLVTIPFIKDHLSTTWVRWLPDATQKILKEHNIPIVLSQPHEYFLGHIEQHSYGFHRPSETMSLFSEALDQRGLHTNDIIIHGIAATHTAKGFIEVGQRKVYEAYCYDYFNSGREYINTYKNKDLSNEKMERYKFLSFDNHIDATDKKDKLAICLNRQPRDLRCLLLLANETYMDDSIFTFLAEEPLNVPMTKDEIHEKFKTALDLLPNTPYTQKLYSSIEPLLRRIPMELQEREGEREDHMNANYALNEARRRAWFEMVTETHEWNKQDFSVSIITEKTIWPILNNMPFCVQGHKENYTFLKYLGFNIFEDDLLNQEVLRREMVHEDLNKSLLYGTEQMFERFNAWHKNGKYLISRKDIIRHNFSLLRDIDWQEKEKKDFIKILNHSKATNTNVDSFLQNKFNY
jgi:hypothetical protein